LIFLLRQVQPKPAVLVLFLLIEIIAGSAPVNSFSAIVVSYIVSLWLGSLPSIVVSDLVRILVGGGRYSFEPPNQKAQVFLVLVGLSWWFSEHACKLFDEMHVRT
jgi:hypothetical protein